MASRGVPSNRTAMPIPRDPPLPPPYYCTHPQVLQREDNSSTTAAAVPLPNSPAPRCPAQHHRPSGISPATPTYSNTPHINSTPSSADSFFRTISTLFNHPLPSIPTTTSPPSSPPTSQPSPSTWSTHAVANLDVSHLHPITNTNNLHTRVLSPPRRRRTPRLINAPRISWRNFRPSSRLRHSLSLASSLSRSSSAQRSSIAVAFASASTVEAEEEEEEDGRGWTGPGFPLLETNQRRVRDEMRKVRDVGLDPRLEEQEQEEMHIHNDYATTHDDDDDDGDESLRVANGLQYTPEPYPFQYRMGVDLGRMVRPQSEEVSEGSLLEFDVVRIRRVRRAGMGGGSSDGSGSGSWSGTEDEDVDECSVDVEKGSVEELVDVEGRRSRVRQRMGRVREWVRDRVERLRRKVVRAVCR